MNNVVFVSHRLGGEKILAINYLLMTAAEILRINTPEISVEHFSSYIRYGGKYFLLMPSKNGPVLKCFGEVSFEGLLADERWSISIEDLEGDISRCVIESGHAESISFLYDRPKINPALIWADRETEDLLWWVFKKRDQEEFYDKYRCDTSLQKILGSLLVV